MQDNMLRSTYRRVDPFLRVAVWLVLVGCLVATVAPPLLTDAAAFRGSIAVSGIVSLSFAGQNLRTLYESDRPDLPAAAVATVFGVWFVVAPLRYGQPGIAATAAAQAAGLIVAAFGAYCTIVALVERTDGE